MAASPTPSAAFGGFVAKYMGDGVLIYFGYPEAHEDDAEGQSAPGSRSSTRSAGSPRPSR
jgi:class 3 adenylate cyclase